MSIIRRHWVLTVFALLFVGFVANSFYQNYLNKKINSFDDCVEQSGGQINLMYPPTCITKDGRSFIQDDETTPDTKANNNLTTPQLCRIAGGTWLKDFNECESTTLTESFCQKNNGKFFGCESPCRHNPKTDMCQTVCMAVCKF